MLLSTGKSNAAIPFNSAVGIGETRALQANLGNNLATATLVAGNANTVLDTVGNGDWKFYVAGGNSIAAVTGASASSEWSSGNLLSYNSGSPNVLNYEFDAANQVGSTIQNLATEDYALTLYNGASIATASPAPYSPGYLSINVSSGQYASATVPFSLSQPWTISFWHRISGTMPTGTPTLFEIGNTDGFGLRIQSKTGWKSIESYKNGSVYQSGIYGGEGNDTSWIHYAIVYNINSLITYRNGSLYNTAAIIDLNVTTNYTYINFGKSNMSSMTTPTGGSYVINIDKFKIFNRTITAGEASSLYGNTFNPIGTPKLVNAASGVSWMSTPATVVDSSETNYTVKSNEIALTPGTNSTYAVWTAPKTTNIRIDVSFADYHSRSSAGVGFQMFKINNDNTFGGVIFPRTVTSTALTNSSGSYLTVPSKSISVATGDKIYYRVDANGNTTAASSVLATAIYTDPNQDLKQYKYLQAHLGNNMASTSFVAGNANVVNDTRGTGSWKFYVAGNTSIASITGSSASSEWITGNLLSYVPPPTDFSIFYPLNIADINPGNPLQVGDLATGSYVYNGTLAGGATITDVGNVRVQGQGFLSLNGVTGNTKFLTLPTITLAQSTGFSISLWAYIFSTNDGFMFHFKNTGGNDIALASYWLDKSIIYFANGFVFTTFTTLNSYVGLYDKWTHICLTIAPNNFTNIYINSVSKYSGTPGANAFAGDRVKTETRLGSTFLTNNGLGGGIDDFKFYNRELTSAEVSAIYSGLTCINNAATGATWMSTPGTPVDASETSYTVKSNEIALTPGTNSTYAVWTATKSTNLKIDVSFADYHTRSSGVGFQMFKIKANNTFDSVLFPRTVTTTALTNAAPSNYLSVPSITTTVNVGDKLYYRVDANGNTVAASSVLATTIFTDDVSVASNPVENRLLQAQLATNMNSTTFVFGNSNSILDTVGTGDWKFYVAGNTSVASITSASASSEWSSGSLLGAQYAFDGTLMNGATIVVDAGSRYSGNPYLKFVNPTYNTLPYQYAKFTPVSIPSGGISFSMWVKHTSLPANTYPFYFSIRGNGQHIEMGLFNPNPEWYVTTITGQVIKVDGTVSTITNGNWHHLVWTISASGMFNMYLDNSLRKTQQSTYPDTGLRTFYNIGSYNDTGDPNYLINGGVDNFKIFTRELTALEVTAEYNNTASTMPFMLMTDSGSAPKWTIKPATLVDASETSYTVKSNEIALAPGTNSTFAVWTAPKTTNIKVDVSFADYHSRSAGVGFQMFKINSDNTFGSVIFPRTVTSTALTNSSGSYLTVPSKSISVATGDKIYYRVDANGNTTAASSVLATNIYVDPNQDLKQYKYLQAHLGNNLSAVSFVAGNANVVNDTLGTGNWNFYVAGNTSIASISSASASSEWTVGSPLSYSPLQSPSADYSLYYTFDSNTLSGNTIIDSVSNQVATLTNGAKTSTTAAQIKYGAGSLDLSTQGAGTGVNAQHLKLPPFTISQSTGFSVSFWVYFTEIDYKYIFDFAGGTAGAATSTNNMIFAIEGGTSNRYALFPNYPANTSTYLFSANNTVIINQWQHVCITVSTTAIVTVYLNSAVIIGPINYGSPSTVFGVNGVNIFGTKTVPVLGTMHLGNPGTKGYFDDFKIYQRALTASNVNGIYLNTIIPAKLSDATGATWMSIPGTPVDASETSYTVKSNEVALTPGTNSTFAVWTATKSTNIKVDVSFADYNSRSAGVGFQMFKIKSDNTFDSVLFPRTVTSTALTNAAPSNYLSVPSITTTVNVGDKLYYRIDANGNTTSASSVLATAIYTDDVSVASNPVETRVLQANLAANLNSGNANIVLDTVGNSNWQFYVAGNTSVASISSASNSTEWTGGSLLSYDPGPIVLGYSFDTTTQTGSTVKNTTTNAYDLTLYNGATIATASPAPNSTENAGYLSINVTSGQYAQSSATLSLSQPFSISFWFKRSGTGPNVSATMFEMGDSNLNAIRLSDNNVAASHSNGSQIETGAVYSVYYGDANWHHLVFVFNSGILYSYGDGSISRSMGPQNYNVTSNFTYFSFGKSYIFPNPTSGTTCIMNIDKFQIFNTALSGTEITALYNGTYVPPIPTLKHVASGATWMSKPVFAVNSSETSYTVKSNEIALTPGTNSTYAVWTAPKPTNIRIDVSFADYHTRSAGVGFQMFKINSDNTFGSVIFPRTVTSTALTNANSSNYLSVPSRTISVSTGDKIYYRIDANGNTTAASSVLATNIYTYSGKWS